ncbi:MAG: adenine phosphoribosyltransferase, partial [Haloarculaceae archaeon]
MDRLADSLRETPIVEKEGYHYFVHPVSDGVPKLEPKLLREIVVRIVRKADIDDVD